MYRALLPVKRYAARRWQFDGGISMMQTLIVGF